MAKLTETQRKILENAAGRNPPHRPFGRSQSGGWDQSVVSCYRNGWLKDGKITDSGRRAIAGDPDLCPVCAKPFKTGDICATDIELGQCHAECLEGSLTVDLETGESVDGPIPTYPYEADHG